MKEIYLVNENNLAILKRQNMVEEHKEGTLIKMSYFNLLL